MGTFTDAEKTDIRRFCGYPVFGAVPSSMQSYRFFQGYGTLEYRINNLTTAEEAVVRTQYLANLSALETAIVGTSGNLDTDVAGPWTHNKREQSDRDKLFDSWRRRFCAFFGVPPGEGMDAASGSRMVI